MNKKWLAGPYLVWMVGFIVIPLILIVYYGLTDKSGAFTLANVLSISTPEHVKALWLSLGLSLVSTVICLVLAYPLAMILRNRGIGQGSFIVFIFILPMWMNFLLRTLAWQTLLEKNGVINGILSALHLPTQGLINTPGAIILGMVYNFLPFMVLPIYNVLSKIDDNVINAAQDLGANFFQILFRILLPLSIPGIVSGINKEDLKILDKDIRFIRIGDPCLTRRGNLLFGSTAYFAALALILLVFAGGYLYLKKRLSEMQNTVLVRNRKANKVALQRLRAAFQHMNAGSEKAFYEEMLKALWGYMSDKLNIPVANLTKDNIREELLKRNVSAELTGQFIDTITHCEYAQYSPSSSGRMSELYGSAAGILSKLESVIKK